MYVIVTDYGRKFVLAVATAQDLDVSPVAMFYQKSSSPSSSTRASFLGEAYRIRGGGAVFLLVSNAFFIFTLKHCTS